MAGLRILVPTDFSAYAALALRVADDMAVAQKAHLRLLHVHPPVEAAIMDFSSVQPNEDPASARQHLLQALLEWSQDIKSPSERVSHEVAIGSPVAEILARCKTCDLAVVGPHGRSGVGLFLLGSVTERIVRGAACSVYVAKVRRDP